MEKTTPEKITIGSEVGTKVNCSMCKKEGTTDQFIMLRGNKNQNVYLCPECKEKTNQTFEDETKNPNVLLAIVIGSVAAIIGGVIWYFITISTNTEFGYISLGLGYLVGLGVYFGAGKKRGIQLQIVSALLTVIAIIVIEKFIFEYFVNEYVQSNPSEFSDLLLPGQSMSVSFFDPEFWENFISPISLLIYAIGIYLAYEVPKAKKI
ncbi:MAG: hypothetical protein V1651_03485 [Patescibacteria group bacterium]